MDIVAEALRIVSEAESKPGSIEAGNAAERILAGLGMMTKRIYVDLARANVAAGLDEETANNMAWNLTAFILMRAGADQPGSPGRIEELVRAAFPDQMLTGIESLTDGLNEAVYWTDF